MANTFKEQALSSKKNLVYTGLILFTHFVYGINVNIIGATLVDLRFIYNVSINTSTYITVATQVGYLIGSLAGWLYQWLNRQLALAIFLLMLAITSSLIPHYPNYAIAILGLMLGGVGGGAWDSASGFWMVEMWPVGNAGLLQFMQFMFGCGTVLAPLLAAPYVKGEKTVEDNGRNITSEDREHWLTLPFVLTGIGPAISTIVLLGLFFILRYKLSTPTVEKDLEKTKEEPARDVTTIPNRTLKLAMCGICLASYATIEIGWFNFSTAMYQYLEIKMEPETADHMQSIVSGTYTLGRLTTAFITIKLVPDIILAYHYLTIIAGFVTIFLGRNSQTVITVGSAILGYGLSACWPGILAFTERHLGLSDRICSIYCLLSGACSLAMPLVIGQTFDEHPMILFVLEIIFVSTSLSMFVLVRLWIARDNARSKY